MTSGQEMEQVYSYNPEAHTERETWRLTSIETSVDSGYQVQSWWIDQCHVVSGVQSCSVTQQ